MKPRLQGWSGDGRDNPAVVVPDSRRMAARANCETESPWKRKNQPPAGEGKVGGVRRIDDFGFWILDSSMVGTIPPGSSVIFSEG